MGPGMPLAVSPILSHSASSTVMSSVGGIPHTPVIGSGVQFNPVLKSALASSSVFPTTTDSSLSTAAAPPEKLSSEASDGQS